MNANITNEQHETVVHLTTRRPTPILAWLPFAVLALTVAAFAWNAPGRLAAFIKGRRAPRPAVTLGIVPTSVNYPVPVESVWLKTPDVMIAHR